LKRKTLYALSPDHKESRERIFNLYLGSLYGNAGQHTHARKQLSNCIPSIHRSVTDIATRDRNIYAPAYLLQKIDQYFRRVLQVCIKYTQEFRVCA